MNHSSSSIKTLMFISAYFLLFPVKLKALTYSTSIISIAKGIFFNKKADLKLKSATL